MGVAYYLQVEIHENEANFVPNFPRYVKQRQMAIEGTNFAYTSGNAPEFTRLCHKVVMNDGNILKQNPSFDLNEQPKKARKWRTSDSAGITTQPKLLDSAQRKQSN